MNDTYDWARDLRRRYAPPVPASPPLSARQREARVTIERIAREASLDVEVKGPKAPQWRVGDVVIVRFGGTGTPYTYIHDGSRFPGRTVPISNAEMSRRWRDGEARLVVRNGEVVA